MQENTITIQPASPQQLQLPDLEQGGIYQITQNGHRAQVYLLARVKKDTYALINLSTGERFIDPLGWVELQNYLQDWINKGLITSFEVLKNEITLAAK